MKENYIIGVVNSLGVFTIYLDDGSNKLLVSNNLESTKAYLELLHAEHDGFADYKVFKLVGVE